MTTTNTENPFSETGDHQETERIVLRAARMEYVKAMVKCQQAMTGTVHKGGANQAQRYRFAGHEQVIKVCRAAMLDNGLIVGAPVSADGPTTLEAQTAKGPRAIWQWRFVIPVHHVGGHTEYHHVDATVGPNDKAAFVASTAADRTLRLRVCGLAGSADEDSTPQSEDPEHDSNEEEAPAPAKKAPKKAPKGAAPAPSGGMGWKDAPKDWRADLRSWLKDPYAKALGVKLTPRYVDEMCQHHVGCTWEDLDGHMAEQLREALEAGMAEAGVK